MNAFSMSQSGDVFGSWAEFENYLKSLGLFHIDLTLKRVEQVLSALELNDPAFSVLQVVGTNGKGSTATFAESIFRAAGKRTGIFLSPHISTFRDMFRIDGAMLSESEWVRAANTVWRAGGEILTLFEWLTVIAVALSAKNTLDVLVLEAGLGGRYDSTTAVKRDVVVFTPIGLDHLGILGETLEEIATDKGGAMVSRAETRVAAITGNQDEEAMSALSSEADSNGVALLKVRDFPAIPAEVVLGLAGAHQRDNAQLALAACSLIAASRTWAMPNRSLSSGLADAWLPGRLQRIAASANHPELLLDGAHNPQGLKCLSKALQDIPGTPAAVIFGCLKDKGLAQSVKHVLRLTDGPIYTVPVRPEGAMSERSMEAGDMAALLGPRAVPITDLQTALAVAREKSGANLVLVCGSLYLLAEFYRFFPSHLERPATISPQ